MARPSVFCSQFVPSIIVSCPLGNFGYSELDELGELGGPQCRRSRLSRLSSEDVLAHPGDTHRRFTRICVLATTAPYIIWPLRYLRVVYHPPPKVSLVLMPVFLCGPSRYPCKCSNYTKGPPPNPSINKSHATRADGPAVPHWPFPSESDLIPLAKLKLTYPDKTKTLPGDTSLVGSVFFVTEPCSISFDRPRWDFSKSLLPPRFFAPGGTGLMWLFQLHMIHSWINNWPRASRASLVFFWRFPSITFKVGLLKTGRPEYQFTLILICLTKEQAFFGWVPVTLWARLIWSLKHGVTM